MGRVVLDPTPKIMFIVNPKPDKKNFVYPSRTRYISTRKRPEPEIFKTESNLDSNPKWKKIIPYFKFEVTSQFIRVHFDDKNVSFI